MNVALSQPLYSGKPMGDVAPSRSGKRRQRYRSMNAAELAAEVETVRAAGKWPSQLLLDAIRIARAQVRRADPTPHETAAARLRPFYHVESEDRC